MQLILYCRDAYGSVSFPAESINDVPAPERHYRIADHLLVLSGTDALVHHDADELLAMPDGLYRMLTPTEQDALVQVQQTASSVQETAPAEEGISSADAETVPPPTKQQQPPALKTSREGG